MPMPTTPAPLAAQPGTPPQTSIGFMAQNPILTLAIGVGIGALAYHLLTAKQRSHGKLSSKLLGWGESRSGRN